MIVFHKGFTALFTCLILLSGLAWGQNTMTDDQVLEYAKQAMAEGKSRQEIVAELSLRGVDRSQAERVYALYQQSQDATEGRNASIQEQSRRHVAGFEDNQPETEGVVPADEQKVFGRDIFRTRSMSFAPSENMATPRNYRLGPGDEVIIDVFGHNQTTLRQIISPEGSINVDVLGPLYLSGKTIEEANTYLKKRLSSIYGGLGRSGTDMRLSLGQIRSIQINIMGDVAVPGTYVLSGFATTFHALYRAGGVKDPGTLRDIRIVRGDKVVASVDVYEYIMKGTQSTDIRLEEGDVILVATYKNMVEVEGAVKRPMYFEIKAGETVADVLDYAGGFASGANEGSVTVYRQNGKSQDVHTVPETDFGTFRLQNADRIQVGIQLFRYQNRTSITGAVYLPGTYELSDVRTAKGLVQKAGGLLPEAFTDRVVVHREHPDRTQEVFSLNLTEILNGTKPDFVLENNDALVVASIYDLKDQGTMTISGMVNNPGTFPFAENTTIEDFIIIAGGLRDGASTSRVDVTRRKKDAIGKVATSDIGEMYSFSLRDGLVADDKRDFVLEPYDEVIVHQSPSYNVQRHFSVTGEVNFPGQYTMTSREERVSDLIEKAGGLTSFAYTKGARLVRIATEEEMVQSSQLSDLLAKQIDSAAVEFLDPESRFYNISLDLETAMANPGGPSDVILREGDHLEIPVQSNIVRVNGGVMYPTAVNWDAKMSVRDYINAAGGYTQYARRFKKYVVSVGGRARKVNLFSKVEPGSEIFVPEREKKNNRTDYSGIIAISSSAASLGTLAVAIVTLVNNLKKQ